MIKKITAAAVLSLLASPVFAEQWQILGARPAGMGGAFVAVAEGPIAQYWNPAGLNVKSKNQRSGMQIPVGVGAEFTGDMLKTASSVTDMKDEIDSLTSKLNGDDIDVESIATFVKALGLLKDLDTGNKGVVIDANAGLDFKFSKLALSVNNFTSAGVTPYIDLENISLGEEGAVSGINIDWTKTYGGTYSDSYDSLVSIITALNGGSSDLSSGNLADILKGSGVSFSSKYSSDLANALLAYAEDASLSAADVQSYISQMQEYESSAAEIIADFAAANGTAGVGSGSSYKNNKSAVGADVASYMEVALGYGWNLGYGLSLGVNAKMVDGFIAKKTVKIVQTENDDGVNFDFDYDQDVVSDWQPAFDLGLLWNLNQSFSWLPFNPRVGLVARNVNNPKFKYTYGIDSDNYVYTDKDGSLSGEEELKRQIRGGLAVNPFNWWTIAVDYDLTENDTHVDGYSSQLLSLGTEIAVFNSPWFSIPLRAGIVKNMADSSADLAYTLGTGLDFAGFHLEASAYMSTDKTTFKYDKEDYTVPEKVGGNVELSFMF